jgi:hypothetical protein
LKLWLGNGACGGVQRAYSRRDNGFHRPNRLKAGARFYRLAWG